jgi:26S proteasome regulatory subunit N1
MVRIGALLGLGIASAGSKREDVRDLLSPFVTDTSATADMEIVSIAALALGMVFVGTLECDCGTGAIV